MDGPLDFESDDPLFGSPVISKKRFFLFPSLRLKIPAHLFFVLYNFLSSLDDYYAKFSSG